MENIHAHTSDREQKIGFYRHGEVVSLTLIISAKFSNYTASKWQFSFFVPFFSCCKEELDRRRELVGVIGRPHKSTFYSDLFKFLQKEELKRRILIFDAAN